MVYEAVGTACGQETRCCPTAHRWQLRHERGWRLTWALQKRKVIFIIHNISTRYLTMCFALVTKNILEVKLERNVLRKQKGRKEYIKKEEVQVLECFRNISIVEFLQLGGTHRYVHWSHSRGKHRGEAGCSLYFRSPSFCTKHPKNTFVQCLCRRSFKNFSSASWSTFQTSQSTWSRVRLV